MRAAPRTRTSSWMLRTRVNCQSTQRMHGIGVKCITRGDGRSQQGTLGAAAGDDGSASQEPRRQLPQLPRPAVEVEAGAEPTRDQQDCMSVAWTAAALSTCSPTMMQVRSRDWVSGSIRCLSPSRFGRCVSVALHAVSQLQVSKGTKREALRQAAACWAA